MLKVKDKKSSRGIIIKRLNNILANITGRILKVVLWLKKIYNL